MGRDAGSLAAPRQARGYHFNTLHPHSGSLESCSPVLEKPALLIPTCAGCWGQECKVGRARPSPKAEFNSVTQTVNLSLENQENSTCLPKGNF